MRKLILILSMVFCVSYSFAQKGKVTQANSQFTAGKLDEAKKIIDEAIQHESCVNDAKSNFVKGSIYQGICESPIPDYKKLDPNAVYVAYEAYQKALQVDAKGSFKKKIQKQYAELVKDFTNKAIDFYNEQNYKGALDAFKKVLEINNSELGSKKVDTIVIFNAAASAQLAEEWDDAVALFKQSIENHYDEGRCYAQLANILKRQGKEEEAVQYLHKGYELFPNDTYMLVELINYYLLGGEADKAEKYLDEAIRQDPANASFYRAKGTLYEKTKNYEKAELLYAKAIEVAPEDFNSYYSMGVLKANEASEYHQKVNDIVNQKEYEAGMGKVYTMYEATIPFFEKANELNPTEKNTLIILKELYFKLRERTPAYQEKYDKVKTALDNME